MISRLDLVGPVNRPRIPEDLPIAACAAAIEEAIRCRSVVIVQGDTGCGKTTQLPKICLAAGIGVKGMIALTQPRRVAARSVAARISKELGESWPGAVAYQVRFDDRSTSATRIKVVTDGLLLAELRADPLLSRYEAVIVDEAHERSLNIDFLLGCLVRILRRRAEFKVIVASATIDAPRIAEHFGGAPVIEVPGRLHPIDVIWRPRADEEAGQELASEVAAAIEERLVSQEGDGLVFLPGEREIAEVRTALEGRLAGRAEVLPLYARLSSAEQDRALAGVGGRRVILATNIAETSLTVPRVRFVVDSGLARVLRYSPKARLQRLPIEPISQASARQRAGRCGRIAPGVCVRLYSEEAYEASPQWTQPEIQRVNLASVLLQMASLGLGDIERFPFIDPPSARAVAEGRATLVELGAFTSAHRLTKAGRMMARLPIDPRLARMLLEARRMHCLPAALVAASALSVGDPRERPAERAGAADFAHAAFRDPVSDLGSILRLWRAWRDRSIELGSSQLRRWCRDSFLSHGRLREWSEIHRQLTRLVAGAWDAAQPGADRARGEEDAALEPLHRALLAGFVGHAAQRTQDGEYELASGQLFTVHGSSALARGHARWIVAAEIVDTGRRVARTVVRIHPSWLEQVAPHLVQRTISDPHWVAERGQAAAWERVTLGSLVVSARRRVALGPTDPVAARTQFIQGALVEEQVRCELPVFMQRNRSLRASIEEDEARLRRPLLADDARRFAFYDARVPPALHSWPSFLRWMEESDASRSDLLTMARADLLAEGEAGRSESPSPRVEIGGLSRPVSFVHAPRTRSDGATVSVPLEAACLIDPRALSWGVPESLAELSAAMIRTLPKHLRQRLSPLAEVAEGAAIALADRHGEFADRLAAHCSRVALTSVRASDFESSKIEPHLRLRVEVTHAGGVVDSDRDPRALKQRVRDRSLAAFAESSPNFAPNFYKDGIEAWTDSTLPVEIPARIEAPAGSPVRDLFPALVDDGARRGSVSLRVYPDELSAKRAMRQGVIRLVALSIGSSVRDIARHAPKFEALALTAVARGTSSPELLEDIIDAVAIDIVDRLPELPRSRIALESALAGIREGLWLRVEAVLTRLRECFDAVPAPVPECISTSVARLFPARAPSLLSAHAFENAPRRLRAQAVRARRALRDPTGERANVATFTPWLELAERSVRLAADCVEWRSAVDLMDLVEEFAVALWAQELGTTRSVSVQRLARAASQMSWLATHSESGQE